MNRKVFPCKYYLEGVCQHGDTCQFSHQKPSATICRYFLKGKCTYGDKCSLLHKAGPTKPSGVNDRMETGTSFPSNSFSDGEKESDSSDVGLDRNAGDQGNTEVDPWNNGALDDQRSEPDRNNENIGSPCHFFLLGNCQKGDDCSFSHSTPSSAKGAGGADHNQPPPYMQTPTRICKHYMMGNCRMGDSCKFKHPKNGKQKASDTKPARKQNNSTSQSCQPANSTASVALEPTPITPSTSGWRKGDEGDDNGAQDTDTEPINSEENNDGTLDDQQSEPDRNNEDQKAPCLFFQLGNCQKGDNCSFAHSTPGPGKGNHGTDADRPSPSVQTPIRRKEVCKQYMMERCQMGDSCKLKHPKNGKQRASDTKPVINQNNSTARSFQPENSTVSVALEPTPISPSTSGLRDSNEENVNNAQDIDTEPIDAEEDNDDQSKGQDHDFNHDERDDPNTLGTSAEPSMNSQGVREEIDWAGNRHDERRTEEKQSGITLPNISQERIYAPIQSPTILYPHVSQVSLLQIHWSQFADPLANPEIAFCKLHAQGHCVQGESCRFRHSITVEEYSSLFRDQQPNLWTLSRDPHAQHTQHLPNPSPLSFSAPPSSTPAYPQLSFPQPPVPVPAVQSTISPVSQECKFYPLGTCRNGHSCPWLHTKPPVDIDKNALGPNQVKSGAQLCKYFASKRGCTRGSCPFSHGGPSSDSYPSSGPSGPQSSTGPIVDDKHDGWNTNWDDIKTPNYGSNDHNAADSNGWAEPPDQSGWGVDTNSWDKPASTSHSKGSKPAKVKVDEWPPTDDSSRSAPWVVAAPGVCLYHAKGTCRKGAKCPFQHDPEAGTPDTTDDHSRGQYETLQASPEESKDTSQVQSSNEQEDSNQWAGSLGDEEIEAGVLAANNDEEPDRNDAETKDLLYAEELTPEPEQQAEPVLTEALEHPEVKMYIMRCEVSFGPDALPDHITTATETNKLVLSNLPLEISPTDIETLANPYGKVQNSISVDETPDSARIEVEFFDQGEARAAFKGLEGYEYEGRTLRTSLQTPMVAVVRSPTQNLNLKVSWPSPCIIAWSHYPTITMAKEEAARLNGVIIRGRTTVVSFVPPYKAQKTSFAIKLENLALEVVKSDLDDVCKGNTLITIENPSYSIDATNGIRLMLGGLGSMEDFDTEPRTNATPTSRAFVMFRNEGVAKQAVKNFDGQGQEFLGGQALTIRSICYSRFRIPRMLFDAIKTDLDLLKAKCEEGSKKCTIQYYDHRNQNFVWVRIYSPTAAHSLFAEMSRALVFFIGGTVLRSDGQDVWDEYFETSSSANALEKIQEKTTTFIHYDHRAKNIRIFGGRSCQEDAQKSLIKLIGKVRSQQHEIDLPRPKLRPIVDDGFKRLQNDVGINKVSIDVVRSKLIVGGSSEDITKAHNMIAAFDIDPQVIRKDLRRCQICHCDPIDSITLSCRHAYCKACLQFAIKQPSQPPFRCISEHTFPDGHVTRCEMALGYALIQSHFSSEKDELLRASFLHHVRSRREDLFFCPSLECEAVHRVGDQSVNVKCSLCVSEICTFCRSHAHIGLSCAEREKLVQM